MLATCMRRLLTRHLKMLKKGLLKKSRLIFVSPWLLAAAISLLTLIIVVLAAKNIQREKDLMTETLFQKGLSLVRFVGTGIRSSMMANMMGRQAFSAGGAQIQFLVEEAADDASVLYIAVTDRQGNIIAHSDPKRVNENIGRNVDKVRENFSGVGYEIVNQPDSSKRIFEVSGRFEPMRHGGRLHRRQMFANPPDDRSSGAESYFIFVGLDMTELENAVSQYRYQVIFLSLVLLLVGLGGWISLLVLQGYRISEQTLNRVQAFTGMLIAKLPVGIIATDSEGHIQTYNQTAAEIIGQEPETVINAKPEDALPDEIAGFFHSPDLVTLAAEINKQEVTLTVAGQPGRPLLVSAVPVYSKEKAYMGAVLLMHDLTDLKRLEKKVRRHDRLAALGKMAAGVAHEVRNPLSSIKGLATLLGSKFKPGSKEQEAADLLVNEAERLNRSITELLNYARPIPLQKTSVNMEQFLANSLKLVHADADALGISIVLEISPDLPEIVVDPDRMNQVLLNLYLNGLQAMENTGQGGTLKVLAKPGAQAAGIDIIISDTGDGISEELFEQILDPYFTTKPKGTGLGLAIANKIIDEHHGTISFVSRKGEGTAVTISLPLEQG